MFKLKDNTIALFQEGEKYLVTLSKTLERKSRFNNDLLYSITVMCCEKLFVSLLSHYDEMADHHMPVALYKQAQEVEPGLTPAMQDTCRLINRFESICSIDGFGYKTPTDDELKRMILGLQDIYDLVQKRITNQG
ncbi:MAG: hypothetical protein H6Q17_2065 [Bacteroidetes bacterium]|jgi:hypothetical protein|nr:hypothetical protein [Bacteroidota bacterium]